MRLHIWNYQIHFSLVLLFCSQRCIPKTLELNNKIFIYVGQGSQKSNNYFYLEKTKRRNHSKSHTNSDCQYETSHDFVILSKKKKIVLILSLDDHCMSSLNWGLLINVLQLIYNLFQQQGSKMTFVQSSIPLFSALLTDCELGLTQLDILSSCYPKFSQKTLKFALQKLKAELEETEKDLSERKRKLNLVNPKKFQITLEKLKKKLQIQKEQLPKLIAQQKSQKDNTCLKDLLGDIDFYCIPAEIEKTPLKEEDKEKPNIGKVYNNEENYIYSSKTIEQTDQQIGLLDKETPLFLW